VIMKNESKTPKTIKITCTLFVKKTQAILFFASINQNNIIVGYGTLS